MQSYLVSGLALVLFFFAANPVFAQPMETKATIYLWATAVDQELQSGANADASRKTVLENLDFALMGEVTHRNGAWLFGLEGFYAKLGKDGNASFTVNSGEPATPTDIDAAASFNTETTILGGFAGYRLVETSQFDLYGTAGLRYTRFDTELTVDDLTNIQSYRFTTTENLTDVTAGVRGQYRFNENWSLPFVADIGTGSSDLTWQAFAGVNYGWGRNVLTAGWRHMAWEIDGDYLKDVSYDGPLLAYSYRF